MQAHQFKTNYAPYLFEDAHYHVEAAAVSQAKELSHNVFQFPDGSVLFLNIGSCQALAFGDLAAFQQTLKRPA